MHNHHVFPKDDEFLPERWLDATPAMNESFIPSAVGKKLIVYRVISLNLLRIKKTHTCAVKLGLILIALQFKDWDRIAGVGDQIHGQLGRTEVLVAASRNHGFGRNLFLNRDEFTCRAWLGPEGSHHHVDRVRGGGW